jgi:hypothetical protein
MPLKNCLPILALALFALILGDSARGNQDAGTPVSATPAATAATTATTAPTSKPATSATQVAPSPDEGGFWTKLYDAVTHRNWKMLAALLAVGVTFVLRKWGAKFVPWFETNRGGVAMAGIVALLGAAATATFSGRSLVDALAGGVQVWVMSMGGWMGAKHLLFDGPGAGQKPLPLPAGK